MEAQHTGAARDHDRHKIRSRTPVQHCDTGLCLSPPPRREAG
jgi:hypothetical protein